MIAQRAGTGPGIGLVWSGNPGYAGDHRRSLALREFRYALPPGPRYWTLQKDVVAADVPWLAGDPPIERFEEDDFSHTAAQIAALDLVVTVDTSILHLAGTVGTPTWLSLGVHALVAFVPVWVVSDFATASAVSCGLMLGYLWYISVHHMIHHWHPTHPSYLYTLKRRHAVHHHVDENANFGVTSIFWDRVFGTARL